MFCYKVDVSNLFIYRIQLSYGDYASLVVISNDLTLLRTCTPKPWQKRSPDIYRDWDRSLKILILTYFLVFIWQKVVNPVTSCCTDQIQFKHGANGSAAFRAEQSCLAEKWRMATIKLYLHSSTLFTYRYLA